MERRQNRSRRTYRRDVTLTRTTRRLLAVAFAVAYMVCPSVEPDPNGPDPVMHWWHAAVDCASIAAICVAVVALWRGTRRSPAFGVAAGVGMVVETVLCPSSGHHALGWWTWVQAALSAGVLATSAVLVAVLRTAHRPSLPAPECPVVVGVELAAARPVTAKPDVPGAAGGRRGWWRAPRRPAPVRPRTARTLAGPRRMSTRKPAGMRRTPS